MLFRSVGAMRPDFFSNKFVLCDTRIVVITLDMTRMFALGFLQKDYIGIQFAQTLTKFVQHNTAVKMGKSLVDVVCSDG